MCYFFFKNQYGSCKANDGKYEDAIKIADEVIDKLDDEYLRFTLFQFIMAVNVKVGNFNQAIKHARLCMEMAKLNDWLSETIESDIHFALSLNKKHLQRD